MSPVLVSPYGPINFAKSVFIFLDSIQSTLPEAALQFIVGKADIVGKKW
jgi:hypothetical protein